GRGAGGHGDGGGGRRGGDGHDLGGGIEQGFDQCLEDLVTMGAEVEFVVGVEFGTGTAVGAEEGGCDVERGDGERAGGGVGHERVALVELGLDVPTLGAGCHADVEDGGVGQCGEGRVAEAGEVGGHLLRGAAAGDVVFAAVENNQRGFVG